LTSDEYEKVLHVFISACNIHNTCNIDDRFIDSYIAAKIIYSTIVQKNKIESDRKFLFYSLISVTLLVFSFPSNCFSSIATEPLSYNSLLDANTQKMMTVELTSLSNPASSSSSSPSPSSPHPQHLPANAATLTNSFIMYENPRYGITIRYPSSWEKIEYPRIGLAAVGSDLVVNFLAPLVNASDHWREHLMIQVLKQTQAKKLIPESIITLGGRHGYTRLYNSTMEISNLDSNTKVRLHLKTLEVWVPIGNGDTYLLTYKAVAARYSHYLPTIQKMLASFRIAVPNNSTMQ